MAEQSGKRAIQDLVDRARTQRLEYRGFVKTNGNCNFCGQFPRGTGSLHVVFDPRQNRIFEFGSDCYSRFVLPQLDLAAQIEPDALRRHHLLLNRNQLDANRIRITKLAVPAGQPSTSGPVGRYVAGGYTFVKQAKSTRTFTVQVFDAELAVLGRFAVLHCDGKTDQDVSRLSEADLTEAGEKLRSTLPRSDNQDKLHCVVCRFPVGRLVKKL